MTKLTINKKKAMRLEIYVQCIFWKDEENSILESKNRVFNKTPQFIHSDVPGPITFTSKEGYKSIVTFVDDYSRYAVVKLMKSKSQVHEKFIEYKNSVENLHGSRVTILGSDDDGKCINEEFYGFLNRLESQDNLTVPVTPE